MNHLKIHFVYWEDICIIQQHELYHQVYNYQQGPHQQLYQANVATVQVVHAQVAPEWNRSLN